MKFAHDSYDTVQTSVSYLLLIIHILGTLATTLTSLERCLHLMSVRKLREQSLNRTFAPLKSP